MYLLKIKSHQSESRNLFSRLQRSFERLFEQIRTVYRGLLTSLLANRKLFVLGFLGLCLGGFLLVPWLGQDFFPDTDSGQFILHIRGKTGMRIEETARLFDLVEDYIRKNIPAREMGNSMDYIVIPYSPLNPMPSTYTVQAAHDGDVLVCLHAHHGPV